MKIVHIAPTAPYNDYWGYQDNLLPKYHCKLGHEVTLIITNKMHKDGGIVETACGDYRLSDGVRVIRLKTKKAATRLLTVMKSYLEVYSLLEGIRPDFVFYHGLTSTTIFDVIRYKKRVNPQCVIVQDNHLDYNIGMPSATLKNKVVRFLYRCLNKKSQKYVERIYGVTPWRREYAERYFGISPQKTDVLIMGADDEKISFESRAEMRKKIRECFCVEDSEFLIVTGGKIDKKKNIHLLMQACKNFSNVRLLVFGTVLDDIRGEFEQLTKDEDKIIYVGWVESDKVYDYFFAADLVFFPGQHSVLWEQACAAKTPCVFERWDGMEHVNNGGNSDFVSPLTVENISKKIEELLFTEKYYQMKAIAESDKTNIYLYSNIAEKSLECIKTD